MDYFYTILFPGGFDCMKRVTIPEISNNDTNMISEKYLIYPKVYDSVRHREK